MTTAPASTALTRGPIPLAVDRDDELKASRAHIRLLRIPSHRFVMIDGEGPPVPEAFQARMPGLFTAAYGLRFALKRRGVLGKVGSARGPLVDDR